MTTPLYALQAAGVAAARHDLNEFEKRVDIDELVGNLLDDLLVKPSKTTPGLSNIQRETCDQLVAATRIALNEQLVNMIKKSLGGNQERK